MDEHDRERLARFEAVLADLQAEQESAAAGIYPLHRQGVSREHGNDLNAGRKLALLQQALLFEAHGLL